MKKPPANVTCCQFAPAGIVTTAHVVPFVLRIALDGMPALKYGATATNAPVPYTTLVQFDWVAGAVWAVQLIPSVLVAIACSLAFAAYDTATYVPPP